MASKYKYSKVIQQYYATRWEDASEYPCNSVGNMEKDQKDLLSHDVKEYRLMGYATRVIKRRALN